MLNLNGKALKKLLISASNNLYNHYREVDALNVFPVPDGDTGINMSLTLTSGAQEITNNEAEDCYTIAKSFSHGLLMGARGNSGVITSQIFRGVAFYLEEHKDTIYGDDLIKAFIRGAETAYKAVMKPVEGTILTVIRESSDEASRKSYFFVEKALESLLAEARKSLEHTPELLPILKEVGVVDSGGAGLVFILEGMYLASIGKPVERNETKLGKENVQQAAARQMENEEFGYCTEFILSLGPDSVKKPFNENNLRKWLNSKGTSLVLVRDDDIVKVHVHTMNPGEILTHAQQYGEFLKLKIENMTEQHHALENGANVEQTEDLVKEETKEEYALIAVCSGEGIEQSFKDLGVKHIISGGQTMNPSSEDFVKAIKEANAKNVYILPNNSNIYMAASQACDIVASDVENAFVIPSKTILQGIVATMNFNPEDKPGNNFKSMKSSLANVKSGEVTFSIRDCELKGVKINKGDFIGIYEKDIICGVKDKFECLKELLASMIESENFMVTIYLGEGVSEEEFATTREELETIYDYCSIEVKYGGQPVYSFLVSVE